MSYKVLLVKSKLVAPLRPSWSLYKGDILFCEKNEEVIGGTLPQDYFVKEIIYWFNKKQYKLVVNQNKPSWKVVTSLLDGMNLIPITILLSNGLLEDVTRDYKIKKILEK